MATEKREATLRFLAQPSDANFGGKVHGGTAMQWMDQAGYVCATGWSGHYCVTAFVGDINFNVPIPVGNLVEVKAKIIHTGKTSMHIAVELLSINPRNAESARAIRAIMVFVAVDEQGKPMRVPAWEPETEEDISMRQYAQRIMELRKLNAEKLQGLNF